MHKYIKEHLNIYMYNAHTIIIQKKEFANVSQTARNMHILFNKQVMYGWYTKMEKSLLDEEK